MLKFMGANTNLSVLHAKQLLEVFCDSLIILQSHFLLYSLCISCYVTRLLLLQDDEVGFAYLSQREARPSLYEILSLYIHL